jgi:hypothetical protein
VATAQDAPPEDAQVPRALRELRAAFFHEDHDKVNADLARFRSLCDEDGYPLVGNLASKGGMYQPSQFTSRATASARSSAAHVARAPRGFDHIATARRIPAGKLGDSRG